MTSIPQTFLLTGEWERAIAVDQSELSFSKPMALFQLGRTKEALDQLYQLLAKGLHPQLHNAVATMIAALESRWEDVITHVRALVDSGFSDPEGYFHWAGALALAGDRDGALDLLERSIELGFYSARALVNYPNLDPLRATPDFRHIVRRAEERQLEALEAFRAADGPRLLGLPNV